MSEYVELQPVDLVPAGWFDNPKESSIWISGYRMLRVFPHDFPTGPKHIDLHHTRVLLAYGSISYLDSKSATPVVSDSGELKLFASPVEKKTPLGAYLMLILPFKKDGVEGDENKTRERINDVIGLIASANKLNMVYEHIFDYVHDVDGNERSVIGSITINPLSISAPDISVPRLNFICSIDKNIERETENKKNRIRLALRWYKMGIKDMGVDAFLKYWIAVETLSMPDTTNIKPVIQKMAKINNISYEESVRKFNIGRIFGLRGKIVHFGEQMPINANLLEYLESIFFDLLLCELNMPSENRVDAFLKSSNFDPGRI